MDVLCSDKTGTLTKNQLTERRSGRGRRARRRRGGAVGKPRVACRRRRRDRRRDPGRADGKDRLAEYTVVRFTPFDPVHKRTEAEVRHGDATFTVTKGAPQVIAAMCELAPDVARDVCRARRDARRLRLPHARRRPAPGRRSVRVPRAPAAVRSAARRRRVHDRRGPRMGLSVRMVTGDHVAIAREIARKLRLPGNIARASDVFDGDGKTRSADALENASGFAEVFPEHKFALVKELQARGHIVGMTGRRRERRPGAQAGRRRHRGQRRHRRRTRGRRPRAHRAGTVGDRPRGRRGAPDLRAHDELRDVSHRRDDPRAALHVAVDHRVRVLPGHRRDDRATRRAERLPDHDDRVRQRPSRTAAGALGHAARPHARARCSALLGVVASFSLFWLARDYFHLPTRDDPDA